MQIPFKVIAVQNIGSANFDCDTSIFHQGAHWPSG